MEKKFIGRFIERFIEGLLTLSGTITSITVLLIIIFLFKEGASLFGNVPVEDNAVIAISKENSVNKLTALQIKAVFNQEITNWKELGGKDKQITLFTINDIGTYYTEEEIGPNFEYLSEKISELVAKTPGIIATFPNQYLAKNFAGTLVTIEKVGVGNFIGGRDWYPTSKPAVQFGVLPLILGTIWVSLGAIIIALPLGLATAIYLAEIANRRFRSFLKPMIELLAGIPSVVYGFFGLVVIVPNIQKLFNLPVGETALAGSVILAIMALPTIITISEDAIRTTPKAMKEASLALGATKWQTITKVIIPYSASGISAGAILGIGRAMGETMAVLMVTGNSSIIPHTFLEPVRTIPATIAAELGEAPSGGLHYKALFALGCILFILTFAINMIVQFISFAKKTRKF